METSLFVLGAHLIGDFPLQTDEMASKKFDSIKVRLKHILAYHSAFTPLILFIDIRHLAMLLALSAIAHFLIDSKRWLKGKGNIPYFSLIVDQSLHIYSLGIILMLIQTEFPKLV